MIKALIDFGDGGDREVEIPLSDIVLDTHADTYELVDQYYDCLPLPMQKKFLGIKNKEMKETS